MKPSSPHVHPTTRKETSLPLLPLLLFAAFTIATTITPTNAQGTPAATCSNRPQNATIYLSADDEATVFHNGVAKLTIENWALVASTTFAVRRGDVLAIRARAYSGGHGIIAQITYGDNIARTGWVRDEFKAYPGNEGIPPALWKSRAFSSCKWPHAIRTDEAGLNLDNVREAPHFPARAGAKYVWGPGQGPGYPKTVYLRHIIGAEACAYRAHFASGRTGHLFVNGEFVASAFNGFGYVSTGQLTLRHGDVVSLKIAGEKEWYGAVVALGLYSTGVYANWRGVKKMQFPGDTFAWMYPAYDACTWPRVIPAAVDAGAADLPGLVQTVPPAVVNSGAMPVRAVGAVDGEFWMRVKIGGGC